MKSKIMNCTKVNMNVIGYLEGTLGEPERSQMAEHLASCKSCHDYLDFVSATIGQIDSEKEIKAGDSFLKDILIKVEAGPQIKTISLRRRFLYSVSAAAAIFFAIVTGQLLGGFSYSDAGYTAGEINQEVFFAQDISLEPIESFFLLDNAE
jgi:anti-sigma factor RsiW